MLLLKFTLRYLVYVQEVSDYLPITRRIENASCQSYVGNDCLIV
jgi:hypothetical protein